MAPHSITDDEVLPSVSSGAAGLEKPVVEMVEDVAMADGDGEVKAVDSKMDAERVVEGKRRSWMMGEEAFNRRMPHHDGIEALWVTKWKFPCSKSVYPFHDGQFEDFEPVFEHLIKNNINSALSSAYTTAFLPRANHLSSLASSLSATDPAAASALYLRAAALLRIARFPYITSFPAPNCPTKWSAWTLQKALYAKAGKLWPSPLQEVQIPHLHRSGLDRPGAPIPAYVRVPERTAEEGTPCPVVMLMTGLDGYRPDNTQRCEEFLKKGWGSVVVEVPGTADSPVDPGDPRAPDRLWDSVLEWMGAMGVFDMRRVVVWGLSCGGYYAVRVAHTHHDKLAGVVAQGAGCHEFFGEEWLEKAEGHEYPFELLPALAMKYGYETVEGFRAGAMNKFSLLENGILDMPSTRLLLVNGTMDGLMPIEDSMLLFEHGSPKEARFFPGALHMGYPMANASVYPWIESVMASVSST